jgi:hypothetical protein
VTLTAASLCATCIICSENTGRSIRCVSLADSPTEQSTMVLFVSFMSRSRRVSKIQRHRFERFAWPFVNLWREVLSRVDHRTMEAKNRPQHCLGDSQPTIAAGRPFQMWGEVSTMPFTKGIALMSYQNRSRHHHKPGMVLYALRLSDAINV